MKSVNLHNEMAFVTPSPQNKITSSLKSTVLSQREGAEDYSSISKVETNYSSHVDVNRENTQKKRSIKMISVTNAEV